MLFGASGPVGRIACGMVEDECIFGTRCDAGEVPALRPCRRIGFRPPQFCAGVYALIPMPIPPIFHPPLHRILRERAPRRRRRRNHRRTHPVLRAHCLVSVPRAWIAVGSGHRADRGAGRPKRSAGRRRMRRSTREFTEIPPARPETGDCEGRHRGCRNRPKDHRRRTAGAPRSAASPTVCRVLVELAVPDHSRQPCRRARVDHRLRPFGAPALARLFVLLHAANDPRPQPRCAGHCPDPGAAAPTARCTSATVASSSLSRTPSARSTSRTAAAIRCETSRVAPAHCCALMPTDGPIAS